MPYGGRLIINAIPDYQANEIAVSFLDTGCGISPEDLNKMFTPFYYKGEWRGIRFMPLASGY